MKKIVSIILAITVLFLSSCSVVDEVNQALEDANKIERDDYSENANSNALGDYELAATEYALGLDDNGQPIIYVKYRFVNNGENANSFSGGIDCHLYQSGVRLERSYLYTPVNDEVYIKSGAAVDVEFAYELIDTTSDVEIVFELGGRTIYLDDDAYDKITQIIKISDYNDNSTQ